MRHEEAHRAGLLAALIISSVALLNASKAEANLCKVAERIPSVHYREVDAMAGDVYDPATQAALTGDRDYNARVLYCNRKRDSKKKAIESYRDGRGNRSGSPFAYDRNLPERIVHGRIRYYGFAPMEYGYLLSRRDGRWKVTVPVRFHFPKLKHPKKLDIPYPMAEGMGIVSRCEKVIVPRKHPRERACRLPRKMVFRGRPITEHLMEYWRETIRRYWSRPGFRVDLWIVNTADLSKQERRRIRKVIWQVRMNHSPNSRAMYHAAPYKPAPIYAGLDPQVIAHEFGHILGLDDEYPNKKSEKAKAEKRCGDLGGAGYVMCSSKAYAESYVKAIYGWIVTRRYAVGE